MTTRVQIINHGPGPVAVDTATEGGVSTSSAERVEPQAVSQAVRYVYPGQVVRVREIAP